MSSKFPWEPVAEEVDFDFWLFVGLRPADGLGGRSKGPALALGVMIGVNGEPGEENAMEAVLVRLPPPCAGGPAEGPGVRGEDMVARQKT